MPKSQVRMAIESLETKVAKHWIPRIEELWGNGEYEIHLDDESIPEEYDEHFSEMCWGWLVASDLTIETVATFSHGERGNELYDIEGLHIWTNSDAAKNINLEKAAKALAHKKMGFSEFKRIVRENS